ncbi:hypothetical protein LTR84_007303 [Exophiala bonariae]|uniref:Uncharacterized protein n=1 Tax=Exophiala bonariae TaxID=1690606 RepID=A0AAV9MZ06_9EURO|nr:hypothetical protein LTR84_007303 [Exophiala bonariae]
MAVPMPLNHSQPPERILLKFDDPNSAWVPVVSKECNFLEIFDISFSGDAAKVLHKATDVIDAAAIVADLPAQEENTIRVYFTENLFIKSLSTQRRAFTGSSAMVSQWGPASEQVRWKSCSYRLTLEDRPWENLGHSPDDYVPLAAGAIRQTLKFYVDATSMMRKSELLSSSGTIEFSNPDNLSPEAAYKLHEQFCERLRRPTEADPTPGSLVPPIICMKQLLLLRYTYLLVKDYCNLVWDFQVKSIEPGTALTDQGKNMLTIASLAQINREAMFYQEVSEGLADLTGAVDVLVESLRILMRDATNSCECRSLAVELQATCTDIKKTMTTRATSLQDRLRLFELSRGLYDAQSIRLLSILASICLPMSLASGILSMQTRFRDLHLLLYDFLGVLVLVGSIISCILLIVRYFILWMDHQSRSKSIWISSLDMLGGRSGTSYSRRRNAAFIGLILGQLGFTTLLFVLGMMNDYFLVYTYFLFIEFGVIFVLHTLPKYLSKVSPLLWKDYR